MKIEILDINKLIEVNKLQEVTSGRIYNSKMTFDPNGPLSSEIFGTSKSDRRDTFAYIDLKRPFIHPHIYQKVLKGMCKDVIYIISGQKKFSVADGQLKADPNGWTGLAGLYDHWDEIDWQKRNSTNTLSKDLLTKLRRDQIFITKTLVCPPAYRDVMIAGTVDSSDYVNQLNSLYQRLISLTATLSDGGLFARMQYSTQAKIQDTLVEIMDYFKTQISRKQGLIRRSLMGKKVDYGVRSVISAPTYDNETFHDNMVDLEHSALPIEECCSTFYPFIEAWVKNFFIREIINDPTMIRYYDPETEKEITANLKDPELDFSDNNIRKIINDYCLNPDNRFRPVTAKVNIPEGRDMKVKDVYLILKGQIILPNNAKEVLNRMMTITDLLYLACVDVCEKRHIMVSRYPVGTDKGIYFSNIRVQPTRSHIRLIFNGKEYPYYPDINLDTEHHKVGVQFIDTLVLSNSHLDGMGADYDGDQVSIRGIWSDEANIEAEKLMNKKMSALNITGTNAKVVSKEVSNSLYELTKIGTDKKKITVPEQEVILKLTPDTITRSKLTEMFADIVDNSAGKNNSGKRRAKYNTWDGIIVPANYFYDGDPQRETTVGKFIFNKFVLEGAGVISITKYIDSILNKKGIENIDDMIAQLYMENYINRKQFNAYIDRRDCLGYWLNGMLAHTISERMLKPLPEIEKKKAELIAKHKDELEAGNVDVMTQISDELIAYAKELLKDDPGMDLYDSGDLDFGNNYRNNAIIKGAVINKITNEFDFIGTSFMDGIDPKDLPAHANSILASQYPASIATADAGYLGKKILALLQMMEVDKPGTDCGTHNLIPIKITKTNKSNMIYTIIDNESGQQEMLTNKNISGYVGQTVKMRSPMSCKNEKICSKCAGNLFYYLDVEHAGLFGVQISHADLNLALKAKHNSVVNLFTFDPNSLIIDIA